MKACRKFIFAALAATAMLAGCAKEITPPNFENDKINPAAEGSRVIAVAFAPQTKTTLEGFQPKFVDGKDTVLISNTKALDTCVVSVDNKTNVATITTKLTGPLTAVYPYKAAKMNENNENRIDTVLVSTEQSGLFADANICMAVMENENDEVLSFKNKTALFCIKPPTGSPGYVEVIAAAGFNIANNIPTGSTHTSLDTIHVATTADSVYVSILVPGNLTIGDLSFSDGTKVKTITEGEKASATVTLNTLYTVNGDNWAAPAPEVECVVIGGKKWATMNLGATTVNDYGKLYSWGNLTGQSGDSFNPSFTNDNYKNTEGFEINNTNHIWNKMKHDAAYYELGGNWRMPSNGDFIALDIACGGDGNNGQSFTGNIAVEDGKVKQGKYWLAKNQTALSSIDELKDITVAGLLYSDGENYLFFPAAGSSYSDSRSDGGDFGFYWSSSWYSSGVAYYLNFADSDVSPQGRDFRYYGFSVRPVSD